VTNITKKFFETARHWEYIYRNPAYSIVFPKLPKRVQLRPEWIQLIRIIEDLDSPLDEAAIACGFFGLLGLGETFALEWSHVDFKMNVIFVNQRIYKGVLDTPKTSSSRVSVIMLEPLEKVMKK
jgi:integrase